LRYLTSISNLPLHPPRLLNPTEMVRMSKRNPHIANRQQSYHNLKKNNKLFGQHFFPLLLLGAIFLAINLYFLLLHIEATKSENHQKSVNIDLDGNVVGGTEKTESTDENNNNMMVPGVSVLSASRVISAGLPFLVYGTAWKKDDTEQLVANAVRNGFRFIDTACQPKHYNEHGVGNGWTIAAKELGLQRSDLFLQTKYTSISGQDPKRVPYDPTQPLEDRIIQSLKVSLHNLQTSYIDSWVMHSPEDTLEETMIAYRVMEQAVDDGKVLRLGISNCYDYDMFTTIYEEARIKPSVLQNRFYEDSDWDQDLRLFCKEHNIWYQSFWTLTANRDALATNEVKTWAASKQLTPQTLLYAYLMSLGYGTPLDGTTSIKHMKEDQALVLRMQGGEKIFESDEDIRAFERILGF
jgi:diketogulonate reductase-like aldo/keto reductase